MGAAMFVGGLRRERQTFNRDGRAGAVVDAAARGRRARDADDLPARRTAGRCRSVGEERVNFGTDLEHMSFAVAIILLISYVGGLFFSLQTHRDLFNPEHGRGATTSTSAWTVRRSVITLALAGVAVGVMSEILVGSINEASESIGLSEFFVGLIVVAIVGNAAEHWVAVSSRRRTRWTSPSTSRSARAPRSRCSSRPCSCSLSFFVGPNPMALVFNGFELGAVVLALLIANHVTHDGESTWYEGCSCSPSTPCSASSSSTHDQRPRCLVGSVAERASSSCCCSVDLHFFARGREPSFRESVIWSLGWLVLSLLVAVAVLALDGDRRTRSTTRPSTSSSARSRSTTSSSSSCCSATSACPRSTARGCSSGASSPRSSCAASRSSPASRSSSVPLRHLPARRDAAVPLLPDPPRRRGGRRPRQEHRRPRRAAVFPVTGDFHGAQMFVREDGRRYVTPLFVCLAAVVAADIAFAVDSIPAAFAITRDSFIIWMERLRAARAARAVRARRGPDQALPLPRRDDRRRARASSR